MTAFRGSLADARRKALTRRKRGSGLTQSEITLLFIDDRSSPTSIRRTGLSGKDFASLRKLVSKKLITEDQLGYFSVTQKGKALRKTLV